MHGLFARLAALCKNPPLQIVILVSVGVLLVADSYTPSHYYQHSLIPAHVKSDSLALGCGALVAAWLIYKAWSRRP